MIDIGNMIARLLPENVLRAEIERRKHSIPKAIEHDEYNAERFLTTRDTVMQRLHNYSPKTAEDELMLLRSFRKVISLDLAHSKVAGISYKNSHNMFDLSFPERYMREDGTETVLDHTDEQISMEGKYVVHTPYDTKRWAYHLKRQGALNPQKFEPGYPLYYPEFNMLIQGNGNTHRMSEAFINRPNSQIMATVFHDEPLLKHVDTNGYQWLSVHSGEVLGSVSDYRLALVFHIRKLEMQIEDQI